MEKEISKPFDNDLILIQQIQLNQEEKENIGLKKEKNNHQMNKNIFKLQESN
jgi:hypothetical protein